jgi:copper chaperone CopZ
MPGVISADANFIAGTATITFDDTKITIEEIIKNFQSKSMPVLGTPKWIK